MMDAATFYSQELPADLIANVALSLDFISEALTALAFNPNVGLSAAGCG